MFGVWKGFHEMELLGLIPSAPVMVACEPEARGPLGSALRAGVPATAVPEKPTRAHSIGTTVSSYRGVLAIRSSGGTAVGVTDGELEAAQGAMSRVGLWQELSGSAGLAGLRKLVETRGVPRGPVVCIATSSGFKSLEERTEVPEVRGEWRAVRAELSAQGVI